MKVLVAFDRGMSSFEILSSLWPSKSTAALIERLSSVRPQKSGGMSSRDECLSVVLEKEHVEEDIEEESFVYSVVLNHLKRTVRLRFCFDNIQSPDFCEDADREDDYIGCGAVGHD